MLAVGITFGGLPVVLIIASISLLFLAGLFVVRRVLTLER